jgi:hypothetical protein
MHRPDPKESGSVQSAATVVVQHNRILSFSGLLFAAPLALLSTGFGIYLFFNGDQFNWQIQGRTLFSLIMATAVSYALGRIFSNAYHASRFSLFVLFALVRAFAWVIMVQLSFLLAYLFAYWIVQIQAHSTWRQFEFISKSVRELPFSITAIEFFPTSILAIVFASIIRWRYSKLELAKPCP